LKLLNKLTLFITLSKLLIVVLFVSLLPKLVNYVSFRYSNIYLEQQKQKVLDVIRKNGLDYYLQGDSAYASYTMLKEEYISLVPEYSRDSRDTIETSRRIIEGDTLNYRILTHEINYGNKKYILEIGRTVAAIGEYNNLLQRFTLYILIGLIALSIVLDLSYTNVLLKPLSRIIRTKLLNKKFPFREPVGPVKTTTSDFRLLDQSLIDLMEKVHEAFEKEREFTSNVSHELLTPISILQSNVENLMMEEELSNEMQEKVSNMLKTLGRLKRIIHSLLYIARIENDQFAKNDTVDVRKLTGEVMEELTPRLESKSINFTNRISTGVIIKGVNHDLFFQFLYNLINNAIRYNKEDGSIYLSDSFVKDQHYIISIKDTGIGMSADELTTIFDRFKKSGRAGESYGLGLTIVKSITVFLGFDVSVTSEPKTGTTFNIKIPQGLINSH
jgi:signal transduction histidine kinase